MVEFNQYVGTWRASRGAPYSSHTFTWELADHELRGRWIIEAASSATAPVVVAAHTPMRLDMRVENAWLEDDLLLFQVADGPFVTEFRLINQNEAIVGVAAHRLAPQFTGPEYQRSIEGHRVRLTRQPTGAV